jgi:hypothetical protein
MNQGIEHARTGQIIILNGTPRSGKSSIVAVIQETFDGVWMNLGVDRFMQMTPARYLPGIGLRPGGERQDMEPLISILYAAMYESIAAHSRFRTPRRLRDPARDPGRLCPTPERIAGPIRGHSLPDLDNHGTTTKHGVECGTFSRRAGAASGSPVAT